MKDFLKKRSTASKDYIVKEKWNEKMSNDDFEIMTDEDMNDFSRDKDTIYAENPDVKTKEEMEHEDYLKDRHKKLLHVWSREGEIE